MRDDVSGAIAFQDVTDRADPQRIRSRFEPCLREAIPSLLIGDHRDRDWRARWLGADEHAFQRPVFRRADEARERGKGVVEDVRERGKSAVEAVRSKVNKQSDDTSGTTAA